MIGLDAMGADDWGTDETAPKWGSGGEGDVGPPAASAPKPAKAAPKTAKTAKPTAPHAAAPDAPGDSTGGALGAVSKKWLVVGGLAAAVVGALIFFFTGGAEKIR